MTKKRDDELDELLATKKQDSGASGKCKKKPSKQAEQFVFGSDSEEEELVDTSVVTQEKEDNEFEDRLMLYDDTTVKECDAMENGGSSDEDEEKLSFDSDGDQSYDEFNEEPESTDDGEAQPNAKRKKMAKRLKNDESDEDVKEETSDVDQKRKRNRMGGHSKKRQQLRLFQEQALASISVPNTRREGDLMSLVFGGRTEIAAQLAKEEKKVKKGERTEGKQADGKKNVPKAEAEKSERNPVWHDSDDDDSVAKREYKINRYKRKKTNAVIVTNDRRRKQFEQIVGNPRWADLDRERERSDSEDEAMRKVGHVVGATGEQGLPKGMIELKMLKNLNRETMQEGIISSINFHPTSMVAIITGKSGMVSIVAVDGVRNEKLHMIMLDKFRISCARLLPDGNEAIFGSFRKFYHVYNLISGESNTLKIPARETWSMHNFRISACGKYLASAGETGEVHVLSANSRELLWTIQLRYDCRALAFTPDSRYLLCHSEDSEVTVYSFEQRRIVNVFHDEGCVNGSAITVCPNGLFVATGSRQGVVNIYALDAVLEQKFPKPLKFIDNLTTYIDSLTFNATSELLAMASSSIGNAIRLVHVKSGTVFKNFPFKKSYLGHVSAVEFSPSGGFLAVGNKKSVVSLLRVKHYKNY